MTANFPGLSGLSFASQIRNGYNFVPRETSIILTTEAPTRSFLEAARTVGVDEIVAIPFTTQTLMARVRSVIERPRPFVDCPTYVGPCRRRLMLQDTRALCDARRIPPGSLTPVHCGALRAIARLFGLCAENERVPEAARAGSTQQAAGSPSVSHEARNAVRSGWGCTAWRRREIFRLLFLGIEPPGGAGPGILNEHIEVLHSLALGGEIELAQRLALVASLHASVEA
ncbi:MAG: hypothetical protein IPO30_19045 [Hyphomonadaceae bacterium]|nr:hypothetical protein [Hyphomonadaceae bacterium]